MHKEDFDYYIFIDYSESLIGYIIIAKEKVNEILAKISKLKHYKGLKNKIQYLTASKSLFEKENLLSYLSQHRITELRKNIELCSEIFDFCMHFSKSKMFISIDDRQYKGFMKIASFIDNNRFKIIKEGQLKKDSIEYQLNLIIDTLLNLKRTRQDY
jgi:hypothetical protein